MASTETVKGIYAGVDVGSLASKSVVIRDGEIVGFAIIPTQLNSEESGLAVLDAALKNA
ncbi:MAG: 2-hydroxyglutaryl-CoA dehydratase, partial [Alphaproteobacteria bacterium]|nr:2-hydroxyglutaryl-CoA dehydratase [Alphaproteobacteria bacterium]